MYGKFSNEGDVVNEPYSSLSVCSARYMPLTDEQYIIVLLTLVDRVLVINILSILIADGNVSTDSHI
jgi:hypothetical protein